MTIDRPPVEDDPYQEYPVEGYDRDDLTYVGLAAGDPYYYAATAGTVFATTVDEARETLHPDANRETPIEDVEEELGEFLESVGEDVGWDGLSEWASEHLEQ